MASPLLTTAQNLAASLRNGLRPDPAQHRLVFLRALATAPWSTRTLPGAAWLSANHGLTGVFPAPPIAVLLGVAAAPIQVTDTLRADEWHLIKHRATGDLLPTARLHEYLADLFDVSAAGLFNLNSGQIFVGTDPISQRVRVGLAGKLAALNLRTLAPSTQVRQMFIVMDLLAGEIVSGFPVLATRVARGYPGWNNRIGL